MIQVWLLDELGFYIGKDMFVEELSENMTTEPLLVGYIKPLFNGEEWIEGATEEEIQAWKDSQPKPPTPIKTNEELEKELADLEIQLLLK